jgi:hypothetical protein
MAVIIELVGLSWDKSTEYCWSIVTSIRHFRFTSSAAMSSETR